MFEVNDKVVYGIVGVCEVEDIAAPPIKGIEGDYYFLQPVYDDKGIIYSPVNSTKVQIRSIISKNECEKIIEKAKNCVKDELLNEKLSPAKYDEIVKSQDIEQLMHLVRHLYNIKNERAKDLRKMKSADSRTLSLARILFFILHIFAIRYSCGERMFSSFEFAKKRIIVRLIILFFLIMAIGAFIIIGFLTKTDNVNELKKTDASGGNDYMYDRIVAITFDDGPCSRTTNRLLDGLKERNVKATFFLVGENAESNEKVVKRMYEEGHLIGNHTYSHIKLDECNISSAVGEINKTNEIIKSITGEDVKYIRPPYGAYSDKLLSHVNMTPVLWSIDPDDWATTDTAYVVKSVVYKVKNGDIILLHDIYDSSVEAALEIIDRLSSKGFVFVTVDQLMLD